MTLTWESPEHDSDEVTGYEYKVYEGSPAARVFPALIDWTTTDDAQEQDIHLESDAKAYTVWLRAVTGAGKTSHQQVGVYVPDRIASVVLHSESETPVGFSLGQNYSNPFNPSTMIGFSLERAQAITLTVYDVLGREVRVLADGVQPAGRYSVSFDASGLVGGTYLYVLRTEQNVSAKKMTLLK